jgi:lipid-A-disaccharide synthase
MQIFFSVGEPSGDLHGANLIRELRRHRPELECVGYGGPRMAAAGCALHEDLTQLAVMWFLRALLNLHRFWGLYVRARRYFRESRPDAVVLIDYPGFNWWIARAAKRYGIPVFYYGVPQLWAWAGWRVRKMRRLVDHVLCKLPFEADWYGQRGCHATYVGHPYFDELSSRQLDSAFLEVVGTRPGPLVTILPGSRTQEVTHNLQWFLKAAGIIARKAPAARFAVASFNERQAELARSLAAACGVPVEVYVGRTPELIHLSRCCLACSGSVSLELLYHAKPSVILYWVARFPYWVARTFFIKVKFITLVNLLASDAPFVRGGEKYDPAAACAPDVLLPEYLTCEDRSAEMAAHAITWCTDHAEYHRRVQRLAELKMQHARTGASSRAAEYLLTHLAASAPPLAGPHFACRAAQEMTPLTTDAARREA